MKEFLGRIKADFLLSSVLCIALGLVFIIWRASVLTIVANVLAVVLIIIGVVYIVQLFFEYSYEWFFSDAGACGFGSGYMVSGTAKGCGEPDTYSHRSGAHFSQHQEYY